MIREFKISYSRINTYLFCPYKYKIIYIDNIRIPDNPAIAFGNIIHKTLEIFHLSKKFSYNNLYECYNDSWKKEGFIIPQQQFEYYKRGEKLLKDYYESFCKSKTDILYVEKSFNTNIGKYKFVGIIDRIDKHFDGIYEVIDYKTHLKIWDKNKVNDDLQLSFYAYACKNIFNFSPVKLSIHFLSKNKKVYTERSYTMISNAIEIALKTADDITAEKFDPNPLKCKKCDFKLSCEYSKYKIKTIKLKNNIRIDYV
jgi:putative RecB family exonuclease